MANQISSFFQTLVAAASEASQVLVGTTALMDAIYQDYSPTEAATGQTLNIAIPNPVSSEVENIGTNDPTFSDVEFTTEPIVFNQHPQFGYKINDFEQYNSPQSIRNLMVDPAIKGIAEWVNNYLAGLLNSANLAFNGTISTTGSSISPAQVISGWTNLVNQKVPVMDSANMSLIMAPQVYGNALQNNSFTQESIVGLPIAFQARTGGQLREIYGAMSKYDQQMPTTGTVGSYTYTSVLMHRWAIAAAYRPLPKPDPKVSEFTYIDWKGLPIRITFGYSVEKSGWLVNIDAGFGASVVRPNMAQLYSTAE
jgi:hypothetical protein